jgi:MFS family permease
MNQGTERAEIRVHWKLLVACFIGIGCGVSSVWFYSIGLFLKPLAMEFGWTRTAASLGPLVGILSLGFISPVVGKILDRREPQRMAVISLCGLAVGFVLLGLLTGGLAGFLVLTFVLAMLGAASSPISFSKLLVRTFDRQRGLALGLAITGTGVGAIVTPLIVGHALAELGWRRTYLVLAVFVLALTLVVRGLLGAGSASTNTVRHWSHVDNGAPLYTTPQFTRLGAIFLLCSLAIFGTIVHLVPMLTDRGLPPSRAASFASVVGIAVIAGRIVTGALLDRFEAGRLTAILFLLSGAGMGLLSIGGPACTIIGTLFAGFAIGAELDLAAYLISRTFPIERYSAAFGGIYACVSIGGGFGPLIAGVLFDRVGNYSAWLNCAAIALVVAAGLAVSWKTRPVAVSSAEAQG